MAGPFAEQLSFGSLLFWRNARVGLLGCIFGLSAPFLWDLYFGIRIGQKTYPKIVLSFRLGRVLDRLFFWY